MILWRRFICQLEGLTWLHHSYFDCHSCAFIFISVFSAAAMKTRAPGYYRIMLGDVEVTALSDGTVGLPADKLLTNIKPHVLERALATSHLALPIETSVNGFLINTGTKLILIDTGAGPLFGPTLGKLSTALIAAGYLPEQVDEVYLTHMHPDHLGGLMMGDKLAFPNAIVRADQHDAEFWLSESNLARASAEDKDFFKGATTSLNPYIVAGKFKSFEGDVDLGGGVKAIATHGHTAGHTIYLVESRGQKLVIWGDLVHVAAVQFPDPSVTIRFDTDSKEAMLQRKRVLAEAAKQGYLVGAAHLSFPGLGHVARVGSGYTWIPVNYSLY